MEEKIKKMLELYGFKEIIKENFKIYTTKENEMAIMNDKTLKCFIELWEEHLKMKVKYKKFNIKEPMEKYYFFICYNQMNNKNLILFSSTILKIFRLYFKKEYIYLPDKYQLPMYFPFYDDYNLIISPTIMYFEKDISSDYDVVCNKNCIYDFATPKFIQNGIDEFI